jgi:hypothetical protein
LLRNLSKSIGAFIARSSGVSLGAPGVAEETDM